MKALSDLGERTTRAAIHLASSRSWPVSVGLSRRGHVLNESHSVGLLGVPFITGQHVAHCIRPTSLPDECDRCTAGREVSTGDFWLGEHGIARRNSDIGSEKKLVAIVPKYRRGTISQASLIGLVR